MLGAIAIAVFSLVASGQTGLGTITGRITDPSGAVIANVSVTATNTETGLQTKAVSDPAGYYELLRLQPGRYTIEAQGASFKQLIRQGIVVQVEDRLGIDLRMEIGGASESVTVNADAPLLRTEDPQTGEVIDYQMIQNVPQYNRDPLQLLTLSGNVQGSGVEASGGSGSDTRINGGRTSSIDYLVDGVTVVTGQGHSVNGETPGMDDVEQFKVITNGASADIGRVSGGIVTLSTKAGTNTFHGQVYEYYKNAALDDSGWSQKALGGTKSPYHNFDTGFTFGGPVLIPHFYNGHSKTFFFVAYEGVRYYQSGQLYNSNVPTDAERSGDFSNLFMTDSNGNRLTPTMYEPCFQPSFCSASPVLVPPGQPNSGSMAIQKYNLLGGDGMHVPAGLITPLSATILKYQPEPNHAPIAGTSDAGNYVGAQTSNNLSDVWSIRIDHQINDNDRIFGRFTHTYTHAAQTAWAGPLNPAPSGGTPGGWGLTLNYDQVLSPTLSFSVVLGGYYSPSFFGTSLPADINSSSWGFDSVSSQYLAGNLPWIPVDFMYTAASQNMPFANSASKTTTNSTSGVLGGSFTKLLNKHLLQFGAETRRFYDDSSKSSGGNAFFMGDPVTQYSYDAGFWSAYSGVNGLGPFLMGLNDLMNVSGAFNRDLAQNYYASYIQDTYKLSPRLTLDLGLRWDMESPTTERNDKLFIWDPQAPSQFTINSGWTWNDALSQAGIDPSTVQTPDWVSSGFPKGMIRLTNTPEHPSRLATGYHPWQFAPRLGFAYKLNEKTVVRGFGGIMYLPTTGDPSGFGSVPAVQVTGGASNSWHQNNFGVNPELANWQTPYTPGQVTTYTRSNQLANFQSTGGIGAGGVINTTHMPHEYDLSFGIQRELGHNFVAEVSYSGNVSHSLLAADLISHFPKNLFVSQNQSLYTTKVTSPTAGQTNSDAVAGPTQLLGILEYPYPYFATVQVTGRNIGRANYESLNLRLERRFTNGLQLLVNYSFAKLMDNVGGPESDASTGINVGDSASVGTRPVQSVNTVRDAYGLSPLDEKHRISAFYLYQLPFGRGRKWLGSPQGIGGHLLDGAIGGWEFSGTVGYRSGRPIVFTDTSVNINNNIRVEDTFGSCAYTGCQNLITSHFGGGKSVLVSPGGALGSGTLPAFNSSAFVHAQPFTYGSLPAVYGGFRNPGDFTSDMSLMKKFPIWSADGNRYLQFRAEAANAFNIAGLGSYNTIFGSQDFGTITSVANAERHIQMSARFVF